MIPILEDIIRGLIDGTMSKEEAEKYLQEHLRVGASEERHKWEEARLIYAGQALTGILANPNRQMTLDSRHSEVDEAISQADELVRKLRFS